MEERKGKRKATNVSRVEGERSHLPHRFPFFSSASSSVHGVCNFNYFISGNPWNIQRRYGMEGELVHVAVLNRLYFSSSRKRSSLLCPYFLPTFVPLSPDLSPSLRLYSIFTLSSPSPALLDSISSTRYVTIALKLILTDLNR